MCNKHTTRHISMAALVDSEHFGPTRPISNSISMISKKYAVSTIVTITHNVKQFE